MVQTALIIPLYNHASRISGVIRAAQELGLPIFVVDDGSTDKPEQNLVHFPEITFLRHAENKGKGAALLTGFSAAKQAGYRWALTIDADGQHLPQDARILLETAQASAVRPLVVGARLGMKGEHVPWTSRAGRGFSNFWVWICGGPFLHDSQSGFRLYPLPETIQLQVQARRYQYEVEVLVLAKRNNIPVLEAPIQVVYQPKGERISHFKPWQDFLRNSATFSRLFFSRFLS